MGDVIRSFRVRSGKGERSKSLRLYFDTGSPFTFIKRAACTGFGNLFELTEPEDFGGLGHGSFCARALVHLEVRLLDFWCRHTAYVVDYDVLQGHYDILVGHDFIQRFDISVRAKAKRRGVLLNRDALVMAQCVRMADDH